MEATYHELLECFGARRSGSGWDGCCPLAHRHRNGDRRPSLRLWVGERGELVCRCLGCGARWSEVAAAIGSDPRDWWPPRDGFERRRAVQSRVVDIYPYFDESGLLVAEKVRKEPGPNGAKKTFSWRRPLPDPLRARHGIPDRDAAWVWGATEGFYAPHGGNPRDWRRVYPAPDGSVPTESEPFPVISPGLFQLPHLLDAPPEAPVAFVEGERKAKVLTAAGLLAVSGSGGAYSWDYNLSDFFAGRRVVVFPDNNPPGIAHATTVAGSLVWSGAAAVKLIRPGPDWPVGPDEDVADWLARIPRERHRAELARLLARFPAHVLQCPGVRKNKEG